MDAIKLSYCRKFVVKQLEETEDSLQKKKRFINKKRENVEKKKRNVKEEEIENEFVDKILKKKERK